ncbi:MAG: patatin-like phospholipase family protein [Hyphomicrobiaceae bacterium]|nr:patatin-like phospholipase family protein [Hyphomicrobiaceae bacterium]
MDNETTMPHSAGSFPLPRGRFGTSRDANHGWSALIRRIGSPTESRRFSQQLNLALQGGGAHGAFTWGVIDALLERGVTGFDGISGTSAGAVNAVALAAGLMEGGADGARQLLSDMWSTISRSGAPDSHPASPLSYAPTAKLSGALMKHGLERISSSWSPYDLNPLNLNPLRDILLAKIDFEKLKRESPVRLFVAATEVGTGRGRVFRTHEITANAVVASACLPNLFPAVRIGRF